jgi:hypothetical protein
MAWLGAIAGSLEPAMPLSAPAERKLLHLRDIELRGYERADGLFDIEAHLTDRKTSAHNDEDPDATVPAGRPIHGMWLRLTVDVEMVVQGCEASSDFTPYDICPGAAPNFARLAGLKVGPGFNRAVAERVGGTKGCTHLRELLGQMATVVFQTLYPVRRAREKEMLARVASGEAPAPDRKPALLGTCIAYAPDSPVSLKRWPHLAKAWETTEG